MNLHFAERKKRVVLSRLPARSPHPARICTRCKHAECPCCPDFCDTLVPDPEDAEGFPGICPCADNTPCCIYETERSPENQAWIDAFCVVGLVGSSDEEGHFTAMTEEQYDDLHSCIRGSVYCVVEHDINSEPECHDEDGFPCLKKGATS